MISLINLVPNTTEDYTLTFNDPCKNTVITALPLEKHDYVLSGDETIIEFNFQVSPSYCPIKFKTEDFPIYATLKDAVSIDSNSTIFSYTVKSSDITLEGEYDLEVEIYDRWKVKINTLKLVELTLINPCRSAVISSVKGYFKETPALSLSYFLHSFMKELVWADSEAIISPKNCGDIVWTFFD